MILAGPHTCVSCYPDVTQLMTRYLYISLYIPSIQPSTHAFDLGNLMDVRRFDDRVLSLQVQPKVNRRD